MFLTKKFDITGSKLVDDDDELTDEYTATNANPYGDGTQITKQKISIRSQLNVVKRSTTKVWLDTKNFTDRNNIQSVGISDTYDAD